MEPDQYRFILRPFALNQCGMFKPVAYLAERHEFKFTVFCRQFYLFSLFNDRISFKSILYQIPDRDYFNIKFLSQLFKIRKPGHRSVIIHDLNKGAAWL